MDRPKALTPSSLPPVSEGATERKRRTILVVSDIHYAGAAEKERGCPEFEIIENPFLKRLVWAYRHFIWRRDPYAHNHLLARFIDKARGADYVVANGDYSCDTAFVGVCDEPAFESAKLCLDELRAAFGAHVRLTMGDHELGKMSLVGGRGGPRLASLRRAQDELHLEPFWTESVGKYTLVGVTSSLLAFPIFESEALPGEREEWHTLRRAHLHVIDQTFGGLPADGRVVLFCHDPTALPFLWEQRSVRSKLNQVEATVIGHLHSRLFMWNSRLLSGMPTISFLGNSIRRMSSALRQARLWRHFRVRLCPALAGIELLKDAGYLQLTLDPGAERSLEVRYCRL